MNIDSLIAPVTRQEFLESYWEKQFLYSPNDRDRDLSFLFTLKDLDRLLVALPNDAPVNVAGARTVNQSNGPAGSDAETHAESLYGDFCLGKTIIVNSLHKVWGPIRLLCGGLMEELVMPVQCNLYVTPRDAQGFGCHWDGHDVLILQLDGSKDWRLYPMIGEKPRPHEPGKHVRPTDKPLAQLTLQKGDVLYIPRGMPHEACSAKTTSVHLTLGLYGVTWEDLLRTAAQSLADAKLEFRRSLPLQQVMQNGVVDGLLTGFRTAVDALADESILRSAVDLSLANVIRAAPTVADGHFISLDLLDLINSDTIVFRRCGSLARVVEHGDTVTFHFPGGVIRGPNKAIWAFIYFTTVEEFSVNEIPGWYDATERLSLVKTLVRAGMFGISDLVPDERTKS